MVIRFLIFICAGFCLSLFAQNNSNTNAFAVANNSNQTLNLKSLPLTFTTKAYRSRVLALMLVQANNVAGELSLNEQIPITSSNIIDQHITSPRLAKIGIGSITTSNYVYYFSVGDKFSSVVRTDSNQSKNELKSKYLWPIERMDTNAAYQVATQLLNAISIDVNALNRDCEVVVRAWTPEGANGKHFVPQYSVYWVAKGMKTPGSIAGVEFLMPTRSLQQLYVKKSQYILRPALQVTNLISLLQTKNETQ